jgi:CubicO group peptidase (beta-lactamase class C family)
MKHMAKSVVFPRSTPEMEGISSQAVMAFLDAVEEQKIELHSLTLVRHGAVVAESWWTPYGPQHPHMLFSLSKSFTSTAIGMAISEGLLKVDDPVVSFFPDKVPAEVSQNLGGMRVRQLLCMSTGHDKDASDGTFGAPDGDWVKAFLALPVEHKPGTHFVYNTAATYMLSAIISKVTGGRLLDYLKPRLFEPLGIQGATWDRCPKGIDTGGFGLSIKTEDIARFGQLYLQRGMWNGKRLIPAEWIDTASARQVSNGCYPESDWDQGYGYQFWRCRHNAYRGDGAFGQYCIVMPEQDAVIAITSGIGDMQAPMNLIWNILLPAMQPHAIPANKDVQEELKNRLECLVYEPPAVGPASPLAEQVSGKTFVFGENPQQMKSMSFDFTPEGCTVTIAAPNGKHSVLLGNKGWIDQKTTMFRPPMPRVQPQPAVGFGTWTAEDTFTGTVRAYTTPFMFTITAQFAGDEVKASMKPNVAFGPTEEPPLVGKLEK